MKTTILLIASLFLSTSIFAQASFGPQSKATKATVATDNSLTMNISEFIMQANPSGAKQQFRS